MLAYIWPDQNDRLTRAKAALEIVSANPPSNDEADAADWVEQTIEMEGNPGTVRVLFHSIAYQYFPADTKERIVSQINKVGELATNSSPFAWLAFEQHLDEGPRLTLRLWPGAHSRVLAVADAHVQQIQWQG